MARSRSLGHGLVTRAKIILMADQGMFNTEIAKKVDVGKWRKRFLEQGIEGL